MKKVIYIFKVLFLLSMLYACKPSNEYKIVWSHYTGWEPWAYAQKAGILEKWAKKYNIKIKLELVEYITSINLYNAKKYWACPMTNMDALTLPAASGVDSTALIIGDFSNGNDGIVAKKQKSIKQLKGQKINLVQYSVSHYLLSRALEMNGLKEKDVKLINSKENDLGNLFVSNPKGVAVTWNPILMKIAKTKDAKMLFDSSKIPGEIIDMMVVRSDAPESLKKALVGAWYETMKVMKSKKAMEFMAKNSGATVKEFKKQLETTRMFYTAKEAAAFAKDDKLKKTMEYVRTFSHSKGLFGKGASKDFVGIEFPDGSIIGDKNNVKLRFNSKYMEMAAKGELK